MFRGKTIWYQQECLATKIHICNMKALFLLVKKLLSGLFYYRQTDGRTDGQTERQTDRVLTVATFTDRPKSVPQLTCNRSL